MSWARMFKAGTWEELRMIAEKNKYMSEAAMAMYELNTDEIIRQQCMAREDMIADENGTDVMPCIRYRVRGFFCIPIQ